MTKPITKPSPVPEPAPAPADNAADDSLGMRVAFWVWAGGVLFLSALMVVDLIIGLFAR
jgi:hypothetical protein